MPVSKDVSARSPKLDRETLVIVQFGADVDESIEMFGGEAVNSNAAANAAVTIQAGIRSMHKNGKTDEEIQQKYENWKLGIAISGGSVDVLQASLAKFKMMDDGEQAAYLEKLRNAAAQLAAG